MGGKKNNISRQGNTAPPEAADKIIPGSRLVVLRFAGLESGAGQGEQNYVKDGEDSDLTCPQIRGELRGHKFTGLLLRHG
jgi:hypothetical protein